MGLLNALDCRFYNHHSANDVVITKRLLRAGLYIRVYRSYNLVSFGRNIRLKGDKMEKEYISYEIRCLTKGFNGTQHPIKTLSYQEKEDALEMIEKIKKNKTISKISLFKVTEKYEKIDI